MTNAQLKMYINKSGLEIADYFDGIVEYSSAANVDDRRFIVLKFCHPQFLI
jgi:hypothetical protein